MECPDPFSHKTPAFIVPHVGSFSSNVLDDIDLCFALYRALLRDTRRTLVDEERSRFAYDVCPKLRYTFRYNARLQSPKDIVEALRQGYAGLEVLQFAINGSNEALGRLPELLKRAKLQAPRRPTNGPKPRQKSTDVLTKSSIVTGVKDIPIRSPPAILDRPYPVLTGRRCVPHLIDVCGITFLRYKKPQPEVITRMIISRARVYERRWDCTYKLRELISLGELEDAWDRTLERYCGLKQVHDGSTSWATESSRAANDTTATVRGQARQGEDLKKRLTRIREKENVLAEEENARRKNEKQQRRGTKRLARQEFLESQDTQSAPQLTAMNS